MMLTDRTLGRGKCWLCFARALSAHELVLLPELYLHFARARDARVPEQAGRTDNRNRNGLGYHLRSASAHPVLKPRLYFPFHKLCAWRARARDSVASPSAWQQWF